MIPYWLLFRVYNVILSNINLPYSNSVSIWLFFIFVFTCMFSAFMVYIFYWSYIKLVKFITNKDFSKIRSIRILFMVYYLTGLILFLSIYAEHHINGNSIDYCYPGGGFVSDVENYILCDYMH